MKAIYSFTNRIAPLDSWEEKTRRTHEPNVRMSTTFFSITEGINFFNCSQSKIAAAIFVNFKINDKSQQRVKDSPRLNLFLTRAP